MYMTVDEIKPKYYFKAYSMWKMHVKKWDIPSFVVDHKGDMPKEICHTIEEYGTLLNL